MGPFWEVRLSGSGPLLKIGEFAELAETNLRTLRYYEEIGLLAPDSRSAGGFRYYRKEAVKRVKLIRELQDLGLPLDRIRNLLSHREPAATRAHWLEKINTALADHKELIQARKVEIARQEARLMKSIAHLAICKTCDCVPLPENNFCQPCMETGGPLPELLTGMF